jgi:hypothetical protein
MAFQDDMLKEFTFFTTATDEEVTLYKLGKIGLKRTDLTIRTMPHSAIRKDYVAKINTEDFIYCINCDHIKLSHEGGTRDKITGTIDHNVDTCWGLKDGINCICKKFIDVEGKRLASE